MRKNLTTLTLGVLVCVISTRAVAQDALMPGTVAPPTLPAGSAEPRDPSQFGLLGNSTIFPTSSFVPSGDGNTYIFAGFGYYRSTGGGGFWMGTDLPAGIQVHNVCIAAYDNDPAAALSFQWGVYEMGDSTGPPSFDSLVSVSTGNAAVPGYTLLCGTPPANTVIRAFADADGDGDPAFLFYRFSVVANTSTEIRFGVVVVNWTRVVSPAPAVATFPVDVPTTHPYFRFVEALAAAGITGGTGVGTFSPDAPLTRGQMAVFLSAALGLNWPF